MSTVICADLIPSIVSYVPLEDLRIIATGSPIFDQTIFNAGIRILYCENHAMILKPSYKVIRANNGQTYITEGTTFIGINEDKDYSHKIAIAVIKEFNQVIDDIVYHDYCDKKILICSNWSYSCFHIVSFDRQVVINDNEYYEITINTGEKQFYPLGGSCEMTIFDENDYDSEHVFVEYIDYDNKYILECADTYITYVRFTVLFEDGNWIK